MPLLAMVKAKWILFGLEAPQFIWVAAALLLLGTLAQSIRLGWLIAREKILHRRVIAQLEAIQAEYRGPGRTGLAEAAYDAVVQVFREHLPLLPAWYNFEAQMLRQADAAGQLCWWATASASSAFNATAVIEPRVNQSFFAAVPGMVTGLGLLCTFVAILVALLDVRLVDGQFQGLDNLISGLSGKFLSSIAALFAATSFLAIERSLAHGLSTSLHTLATTLDGLVPRLSPTSILVAMQQDMAEQGAVLQRFTSHFTTGLQEGVSDSIAPMLERMMTALAHQQETLTRACTGLIQHLEQSLDIGLERMGGRFTESLHTTTEQMALGNTQMENFTAGLQGFMGQMHEATGLSVQQMAAALTTVVHDLSTKVTELSQQMTQTVVDSAGQAAGAAQAVIDKADGWSAQSAAQLMQLLERHQGQLDRGREMQTAFDTSLGQFKEALGQYHTVTGHVRQIAAAAASISKAISETGVTTERTATMAAVQAERFAGTVRRQEDIQQQVAQSMRQYQQVFSEATQATHDLLTRMEQHLHHYTTLSAEKFESVIQTAEAHLAQATRRLGDTVNSLEVQLRGVTESLERLQHLGEVHGSPRG
jgi:hypothetical protein